MRHTDLDERCPAWEWAVRGITRHYLWLAVFCLCAGLVLMLAVSAAEFDKRKREFVEVVSIAAAGGIGAIGTAAAPDRDHVTIALGEMTTHRAIDMAAVFGADESLIAGTRSDSSSASLPGATTLRQDAAPADATAVGLDSNGAVTNLTFWPALMGRIDTVVASAPIIHTVASSTAPPESAATGVGSSNRGSGSRIVDGYLVLGTSARAMAWESLRRSWPVALFLLIVLPGIALAALLASRQFRAPADAVAKLSQRVRQGDLSEGLNLSGPGSELRDLFRDLNDMLAGFRRYQEEVESGRKLLERKADESAARLSMREAELEKAAEEISDTRDRLRRAANYDALTGLPNRNLFDEQLSRVLRDTNLDLDPVALLLINLRNFRRVNESLGYGVGDELLIQLANRLRAFLDETGEVSRVSAAAPEIRLCRSGGDEFTVVLERLHDTELAANLASRILEVLAQPIIAQEHELVLSASIGVALAPTHGETVPELLRAATAAMRDCRTNHGGYRVFNKSIDASGVDDFRLESDLRRALEDGQLSLLYQPQVDTFDGSIVGAEGLLRWEHPELGPIPPDRFIPLAEQSELIGRLGEWVLREVSRQVEAFRVRNLELPRVAVNVSARELDTEFVRRVSTILESSGMAPSRLELGLSEAVLSGADPAALQYLVDLRNLGIYLSLDNFGTSGVPLDALVQLRLREVKLARAFVSGCNQREDLARMVKGVIAMAQSLKLRVVAEGVETAGEYRLLSSLGVRGMQGYLFSKPVSADELAHQLSVPWFYSSQIQRMALTD